MNPDLQTLLPKIIEIAKKAAAIIDPFYRSIDLAISKKIDDTYLTPADTAAHECIVKELMQISDYPILSEEGPEISWAKRQTWSRYWLVDPLDGTRGFIKKSPEYTVNIALIDEHDPILGVVYAPEKNILYYAAKNHLAYRQVGQENPTLMTTRHLNDTVQVVVGRHYNSRRMNLFVEQFPHVEITRVNSSLKFGLIAEGLCDFYPRFGPICEWDTAAGHCVLQEAGGVVVDFDGRPLQYNVRESLNCPAFMALGDRSAAPKLLEIYDKIRSQL
jgi:3'(2'), 5'-bisphosphate nucleotidase